MSLYALRCELHRMGIESLPVRCGVGELSASIPLPAIALLRNEHYVIVYGTEGATLHVADPALGLAEVDRDAFCEVWCEGDDGIVLVLDPNGECGHGVG